MRLGENECLWPAYRLVHAGWCSVVDLDVMTLDDILEANDILDAVQEARA